MGRSPWDGLIPPPSSSSVSSPFHMSSESPELFHRRNMRWNMGMGQTTQMMIKKIRDLQMKLNPKKEVKDLKKVMKSPMMVVMSPKKVVKNPVKRVTSPKKVVMNPKMVVKTPKMVVMNPKMVVVNLMVMKNLTKVVRTQVMVVIKVRRVVGNQKKVVMGQVMVVSNQMKVVRDPKKVVMKKVKATPPQHHHQHSPVGIYHQLKNQEHQMMMKNAFSHARHHFHHQHYHLVMGYQNLTLSPAVSPACHPYPSIIVILRYGPLKKWTNLQPI